MYPVIIILTLVAIAAAGKNTTSILFAPLTTCIQFLGSLIEDGREQLKHYILTPEPPGLIRYTMSVLFTIGSIGYSLLDAIIFQISLKVFLTEKGLQLFKTNVPGVDYFVVHYLYSCLSIILILLLTVCIHYVFSYIANRFPNVIEPITFVAVIIATLGMIIVLAFMRFYSARLVSEINMMMSNHNYSISTNLTNKIGWISMALFVWGILCAGLCAHLGVNQFITQTVQIGAGILFLPTTIIYYGFIIASKIIESIKAIIEVPISAIANIMQYTKEMFGKKNLDYRVTAIFIVFILSLFLTGCKMPESHPKMIIAVVDLSTSFQHEHNNSINKLNELIDCLEEKDSFYCLFITDESYSNKQLIYLLPETENADIDTKMNYYRERDSVKQAIAEVIKTEKTNRTDVLGALYRVHSICAGKESSNDKYLFVFSDASDNVNKDMSIPGLDSINVMLLFANTDKQDHASAKGQKDSWSDILNKSNAKTVNVLEHDLSQAFNIKQYLEGGN